MIITHGLPEARGGPVVFPGGLRNQWAAGCV